MQATPNTAQKRDSYMKCFDYCSTSTNVTCYLSLSHAQELFCICNSNNDNFIYLFVLQPGHEPCAPASAYVNNDVVEGGGGMLLAYYEHTDKWKRKLVKRVAYAGSAVVTWRPPAAAHAQRI